MKVIRRLLAQLIAERQRLQNAIDALSALGSNDQQTVTAGKKRTMSAEARRKISEAQKKRWAAQKKKPASKASAAAVA
jgi:hypothetical protein